MVNQINSQGIWVDKQCISQVAGLPVPSARAAQVHRFGKTSSNMKIGFTDERADCPPVKRNPIQLLGDQGIVYCCLSSGLCC